MKNVPVFEDMTGEQSRMALESVDRLMREIRQLRETTPLASCPSPTQGVGSPVLPNEMFHDALVSLNCIALGLKKNIERLTHP